MRRAGVRRRRCRIRKTVLSTLIVQIVLMCVQQVRGGGGGVGVDARAIISICISSVITAGHVRRIDRGGRGCHRRHIRRG